MAAGGVNHHSIQGMTDTLRLGNRSPTPNSTQVQAIKVGDLAVAPIGYMGWLEQRRGLAAGQVGQESLEPCRESGYGQDTAHQQRLGQCGRQKVVARRLPSLANAIAAEPGMRSVVDQIGQRSIMLYRPIVRECRLPARVGSGSTLTVHEQAGGTHVDIERAVEGAALHSNVDAVGSVALAGIAAICGELARLGALDTAALDRISGFMTTTIKQTAVGQDLRRHMHDEVERHFSHLKKAIGTGPPNGGEQ